MSIDAKDIIVGQVFKTLSPKHGNWCVASSKEISKDGTEAYVTFINEDGWADTVTGRFDLELIKQCDNWQDMFPVQTPKKKSFLQALSDLQNSITKVVKNTDNPYYKSKYADLNALFEQIKPLITEKGFVLIQVVRGSQLHTELVHLETGESICGDMDLLTVKPDMQQLKTPRFAGTCAMLWAYPFSAPAWMCPGRPGRRARGWNRRRGACATPSFAASRPKPARS